MLRNILATALFSLWFVLVGTGIAGLAGWGYCHLWDRSFCKCSPGEARGQVMLNMGSAMLLTPVCLGRD